MYEVRAILKYQYYAYKESWEQARLVAYIIAQCNSTKKLKLQDISKFYWEDGEVVNDDTYISTSDLQRLKDKAKYYLTKLGTENGY